MEHRLGTPEDLNGICTMIRKAIGHMEDQGIHQWDEKYPHREDFEEDIRKRQLYVVEDRGILMGIYVLNREWDPEYDDCSWENEEKTAIILHRFCISPEVQGKGLGKQILHGIEDKAAHLGYTSVRLDAFTQNPAAMHLYHGAGYEERGYADWRMGRFAIMEKQLTAKVNG